MTVSGVVAGLAELTSPAAMKRDGDELPVGYAQDRAARERRAAVIVLTSPAWWLG